MTPKPNPRRKAFVQDHYIEPCGQSKFRADLDALIASEVAEAVKPLVFQLKVIADLFHNTARVYGGSLHNGKDFTECTNGWCMESAAAIQKARGES